MATATAKHRPQPEVAPTRPAEVKETLAGRASAASSSSNGATTTKTKTRKYPPELIVNGEYSPTAKFPEDFNFDGYKVKVSTALQVGDDTMSGISPDKLSNPSAYWKILADALQAEALEFRKYEENPALYTPTPRGASGIRKELDDLTAKLKIMLDAKSAGERVSMLSILGKSLADFGYDEKGHIVKS